MPAETGIPCEGWVGECESKNATLQRQNTQYIDDSKNWVTLCPDCMEINREHWEDMWSQVYGSIF